MRRVRIQSTASPVIWDEPIPDYISEHFHECQTNGANPDLEHMTYDGWTRPISIPLSTIGKLNGNHFIFGYVEAIAQGEARMLPLWALPPEQVLVTVCD